MFLQKNEFYQKLKSSMIYVWCMVTKNKIKVIDARHRLKLLTADTITTVIAHIYYNKTLIS